MHDFLNHASPCLLAIFSASEVLGWKILKDRTNSPKSMCPFLLISKRSNICQKCREINGKLSLLRSIWLQFLLEKVSRCAYSICKKAFLVATPKKCKHEFFLFIKKNRKSTTLQVNEPITVTTKEKVFED